MYKCNKFSTLNHLNLLNGFHTIYFKIFRSLEYIGLGGRGFRLH